MPENVNDLKLRLLTYLKARFDSLATNPFSSGSPPIPPGWTTGEKCCYEAGMTASQYLGAAEMLRQGGHIHVLGAMPDCVHDLKQSIRITNEGLSWLKQSNERQPDISVPNDLQIADTKPLAEWVVYVWREIRMTGKVHIYHDDLRLEATKAIVFSGKHLQGTTKLKVNPFVNQAIDFALQAKFLERHDTPKGTYYTITPAGEKAVLAFTKENLKSMNEELELLNEIAETMGKGQSDSEKVRHLKAIRKILYHLLKLVDDGEQALVLEQRASELAVYGCLRIQGTDPMSVAGLRPSTNQSFTPAGADEIRHIHGQYPEFFASLHAVSQDTELAWSKARDAWKLKTPSLFNENVRQARERPKGQREENLPTITSDPLKVLNTATQKEPTLNILWGVVGVISVLLFASLLKSWTLGIFGGPAVIVAMFILWLFRTLRPDDKNLQRLGVMVMYVITIIFLASICLVLSSFFFDKPISRNEFLKSLNLSFSQETKKPSKEETEIPAQPEKEQVTQPTEQDKLKIAKEQQQIEQQDSTKTELRGIVIRLARAHIDFTSNAPTPQGLNALALDSGLELKRLYLKLLADNGGKPSLSLNDVDLKNMADPPKKFINDSFDQLVKEDFLVQPDLMRNQKMLPAVVKKNVDYALSVIRSQIGR